MLQVVDKTKIYKELTTRNRGRVQAYDKHCLLNLYQPGHAPSVSVIHSAICWTERRTKSSHISTVLFVLTVATVRGETQVGRRGQMFCAAVNL